MFPKKQVGISYFIPLVNFKFHIKQILKSSHLIVKEYILQKAFF